MSRMAELIEQSDSEERMTGFAAGFINGYNEGRTAERNFIMGWGDKAEPNAVAALEREIEKELDNSQASV